MVLSPAFDTPGSLPPKSSHGVACYASTSQSSSEYVLLTTKVPSQTPWRSDSYPASACPRLDGFCPQKPKLTNDGRAYAYGAVSTTYFVIVKIGASQTHPLPTHTAARQA